MTQYALPHQRGSAFEELLDWQHGIYWADRRALVWKTGLRAEVKNSRLRGSSAETCLVKARPDYEGVLITRNGRHVCFDAKTCAHLLYRHDPRRLHQLQALWDVHEACGIAFLLVSLNLEREYLIWPQPGWATAQPFSIRLDQLDGRGVEIARAGGYQLPNWLSTIEEVFR
jgi:penicillin-binding protein-related factor A (putative recombinase)